MDAAAELFHRNGYRHVGMGDIAEVVGVRPSALYRHFAGKQELLTHTIRHCLEPIHATFASQDLDDSHQVLRSLATVALDKHELGVLWHREARNLPASNREELRAQVRQHAIACQHVIRSAWPSHGDAQARLRVWCVFGVLLSVSNHSIELPRPEYDELLYDMIMTIVDHVDEYEPDTVDTDRPATGGLRPQSRREALIAAATRLFAERGYATVGMEDIGAAVQIAGPSIYNHFENKADLLSAITTRGVEWLQITMTSALASTTDETVALDAMLRSYIQLAFEHSALIDVVLAETAHLPEAERRRARQAQSDYIAEWVHLVQANKNLPRTVARARVHATLSMINDVARTPNLRHEPETQRVIYGISAALLQLTAPHGSSPR